ncbi:cytochrome oxidase complex assembly protein 1-domain-containing protein [Panaeolus papilionaceus]|nr:cytochrome oxidase complex assembly protein 1-domain-containing protein [Panaeolus papilionaceus]
MSLSHSRSLKPTFKRVFNGVHVRQYATELPRSRPPPPGRQVVIETFSEPSRPRPYYAKHPPFRDLPRSKPTWPILLAAAVVGVSGWVAFMTVASNQEKLSTSVYRSIMRALKANAELQEKLGDVIRPQPEWWLNGDPHISGQIAQLAGNIDVSFRVRGSKGSGTVYFTSIRKEKGAPYTVLRFKVICDDGTVVHISDSPSPPPS